MPSVASRVSSQDRIRTCTPHYRECCTSPEAAVTPICQLTNVFSYFINTSPRTTSASLYQFHLGYVMILLVKRPQSKPVCTPYGTRTRKLSRERGVS